MIIITGAAGFIGSNIVKFLNSLGKKNLILVDDFNGPGKDINILSLEIAFRKHLEKVQYLPELDGLYLQLQPCPLLKI